MERKRDKLMHFFQKLGKAIMMPIAAVPVAAILLRLGQPDIWGPNLFSGNGIPWMVAAGEAIMNQMNLLFAIGIAIGLADDNNGVAGLAGVIGYFVLTNVATDVSLQYHFNNMVVGGYTFDMGLFASIITGIISGLLYNRYKEIKLPEFLGFFGGKRFVPIITSLVMIIVGIFLGWFWPYVQENIKLIGNTIATSGVFGAFVFGFFNRLLIPFGLHHILNSIFWFQFGEFTTATGEVVTGDVVRFLNGDPTAGLFQTGFFPIMMFALPAVCIAMVLLAKKERKKGVTGILLGMAFTSFLTGITEPIEFMFLFLSPGLFVVHAFLTGLSLAVTAFLGMRNGYSFSAGFIDYALNFNLAEKPISLLIFGVIVGIIYFIIFYAWIRKFDLQTPGREREEIGIDIEEIKEIKKEERVPTDEIKIKPMRSKIDKIAEGIVEGVGGYRNILYVDACVTRVRLKLDDGSRIDKDKLKEVGAIQIIGMGQGNIQIIIGTMADPIVSKINKIIKKY